ncbi:MAG: agmatine deiminase family protein [Bacteroidales bacterium]|jgi:agmatine/peptidylarginine deiminase|nr:agmatine deiminase family protein [Bacteroidales bacterium]
MNQKIAAILIFLTAFCYQQVVAQKAKPDYRKLHYLSEEEMHMDFDASRDFFITDPPMAPVRNVAEFEEMQSVLVRYPLDIPVSVVREIAADGRVLTIVANASQQQTALNYYQSNSVNTDNCEFLLAPSDSEWTRDYGPWFVFDGNNQPGIVNFPYNRPRPNDNDIPIEVSDYLGIDLYGMNLETAGGNYMCDGMGKAASTDLIWDENSQYTHNEIDEMVQEYLGIEEYFVTADPLDDYIKHIDCWGKFLSPGKILIGQVSESDYRYEDYEAIADFYANEISSYGVPYEVFRVYTPGSPQTTPYTNSLIINKKVLVPITGSPWDDEAIAAYEEAMPGYEIVGIMYNYWYNTDALHCRTKGIADVGMLYFHHVPLLGEVPYEENIEIATDILAYSDEEIYADSVFLIYSINGSDYDTILMTYQSENTWKGAIADLAAGDEIDYYLYAADASGRQANNPYIGLPDPHEFTVASNPEFELTLHPDTVLFLEAIQMEEGIELQISSNMDVPVMVNSITQYGAVFPWYVEEMPELPYQLMEEGSLSLNIMCHQLVALQTFYSDTMYIETDNNTYKGIIVIDSALLLSGLEETSPAQLILYPNPFQNHLNIEFVANEQADYTFSIYDISGRLVDQVNGKAFAGSNKITWRTENTDLKPGYYIYQFEVGDILKSGKIILNR